MVQYLYNCSLEDNVVLIQRQNGYQNLRIEFHRTVRVPDNQDVSVLPPNLGLFPLHKVKEYATRLPDDMVAKGGLFMPMHIHEAMWVSFSGGYPFAIKLYVGGVNVVSGLPYKETGITKACQAMLRATSQSIQDYMVTPSQLWLDGIATGDGTVRQFVAMPMSGGYSIEAQITGQEIVGGLQFEVTPAIVAITKQCPNPLGLGTVQVFVKTYSGNTITLEVHLSDTVDTLKAIIHAREGVPPDQQRLICGCEQLNEGERTLTSYGVRKESYIHLVGWLLGGGLLSNHELVIAAGGSTQQTINKDRYQPGTWHKEAVIVFNVQILNAQVFEPITGSKPPPSPITAETYAKLGLPFVNLEEKLSRISGAFDKVKSVAELDEETESSHKFPIQYLDQYGQPIHPSSVTDADQPNVYRSGSAGDIVNPLGPLSWFRSVKEIQDDLDKLTFA